MTRQEHLRSQILQQAIEIAHLKIVLLAMRHGTDDEAAEILARLRIGESVEQLGSLLERKAEIL
jgi:hypothetical protein